MIKEKAAIFIDNSNVFKGFIKQTQILWKSKELDSGKFLRFRWDKLIEALEAQESGIDIYSRHFFASIRPDVNKFRNRSSDEQVVESYRQSAQSGFYKKLQEPPLHFTLHDVPLKNRELYCGTLMKKAAKKCSEANNLECGCAVNIDKCKDCKSRYQEFYEKGVDVALATQLIISCSMNLTVPQRIILVSGDGDYVAAVRHVRQVMGKNVQIVSWKFALSRDLEKLANKPTIYLDDHWKQLCEVKKERPQTEEIEADVIEDLDVLEM